MESNKNVKEQWKMFLRRKYYHKLLTWGYACECEYIKLLKFYTL